MRDVSLELRPLTVLLGANGAGKSAFLEMWRILGRSAKGELSDALIESGGLAEVMTRDRAQEWSVTLQTSFPPGPALNAIPPRRGLLEYDLHIQPATGWSYVIASESFSVRPSLDANRPLQYFVANPQGISLYCGPKESQGLLAGPRKQSETALSQVWGAHPDMHFMLSVLASCASFSPVDVSVRSAIRLPQSLQPVSTPGANAESLVSALYSLRETDRDRYEMVEDTLHATFPDFERLEFPLAAAGMAGIAWKDRNFTRPLYAHQLSAGTLRFLWLTALLSSARLPAIVLLDEPEASLHPKMLSMVADMLRQAALSTNVFVATHSDHLVRFLKPEEVVIVDVEDGDAQLTWADSLDLEHWLADYTLDQLWDMGQLGGRP